MMRIPFTATLLLALVVTNLAVPVDRIPQKLHRETTKEILNLEQELKKAAGEDEKPHPAVEVQSPPQQQDQDDDSQDEDLPEMELQQEKEFADKAAAMKAMQDANDYDGADDGDVKDDGDNEQHDTDTSKQPDSPELPHKQSDESDAQELDELKEQQEELSDEKEEDEQDDEEEMNMLPSPEQQASLNQLYEEYVNEQEPSYYDMKRGYVGEYERDNSRDMFMATLLETLKQHPELLSEMQTEEEPEQNYGLLKDRDEALQAEYLAATRGQDKLPAEYENNNPYQDRYFESNDVGRGPPPPVESPPYVGSEAYESYPSDSVAKVVAKKWGYETPDEYHDLAHFKVKDEATDVDSPPMIDGQDDVNGQMADEIKTMDDDTDEPQHMEPIM